MADIVFTEATVLASGTNYTQQVGLSGGAVAKGQIVYFDSATNSWKVGTATAIIIATAPLFGFSLNKCVAAGEPIAVFTGGILACNGLTSGKGYVLSGVTAGAIADFADLVTNIATWYGLFAGFATSTTTLKVALGGGPLASGVL